MKTFYRFIFLKAVFLLLLLTFSNSLMAQLPQYYNYNTNGTNNSFPLGIAAGKNAQWLLLAGDLSQPTPAPAGNITKFWFRVGDTYPINNVTYTTFEIKLRAGCDYSFTYRLLLFTNDHGIFKAQLFN